MAESIQAIRGMNDILPDEAALWEAFEQTVRSWAAAYGYRSIRFPIVEQSALFVRSIGAATDIVEKEMYTFTDALNGDRLALRPEGTASCLRAVIQHNLLYNAPQRLWYAGPMFRHERPQKGRYRQFHQIGVEALGFPGPDIDAEHIVMTARLWRLLGLGSVLLQINTLGSPESRARHRARLIGYFESHKGELDDDAVRRLHSNPLRILDSKNPALQPLLEAAPRLFDDLDEVSLKHFEGLQSLLRAAEVVYSVNPRLVRGLDYYNATVFEWVIPGLGAQDTVCGGGRYDSLIELLGGKPAPGCGFAMGIERILSALREKNGVAVAPPPDVYVAHQGAGAGQAALQAAEKLRDAGWRTILHCGQGALKAQLRKADQSGASFAVIIGEDEISAAVVSVKPLRGQGDQTTVSLSAAIDLLQLSRSATQPRAPRST